MHGISAFLAFLAAAIALPGALPGADRHTHAERGDGRRPDAGGRAQPAGPRGGGGVFEVVTRVAGELRVDEVDDEHDAVSLADRPTQSAE